MWGHTENTYTERGRRSCWSGCGTRRTFSGLLQVQSTTWPIRGGLVQHSLNVFEELLGEMDFGDERITESIAICGLLHDICKANYYAVNYKQDPEGGISHYSVKDKLPMGHGEKSVYLIQKFMQLTDEEALAIRWHMGAWDDAVRGGSRGLNEAMKVSPLVYELHAADMRATHILEVE